LKKRAQPVTDKDHRELQESYWKKMEPLIRRNYFKDPRYTPKVVNSILRDARKNGYIRENARFKLEKNLPREQDYLLAGAAGKNDPSLGGRKEARQVLKEWVTKQRAAEVSKGILVKGSVFNLKALDAAGYKDIRVALEKLEKQEPDPAKRIKRYKEIVSPEITRDVIYWTVDNLTRGHIPQKFGPYVHVQFENQGGPRQIEKQLKESDRRAHIKKVYGVDLKFGRKADYFKGKDQVSAIFVKWGHNIRTIARDFGRRGIKAHSSVKGYQSAKVLNDKVESGAYPQMGTLDKRSVTGRSRVRAKRVKAVRR
jgi:hypothetical protein